MNKVDMWKRTMDNYYASVDKCAFQSDLECSGFSVVDITMFAHTEVAATTESEQLENENDNIVEAVGYVL